MPYHDEPLALPEVLTSGEEARLFPVLSESSKEGRALSIFLSCLARIDELGRTMLSTVGQRVGARTKTRCFTEVGLAELPEGLSPKRPDGLIHNMLAKKEWSALVEAKVKKANLEVGQTTDYLKLAKANGVNALITISNDFAAIPQHHPLSIPRPPKNVDLFHWSWASILTHSKVILSAAEELDKDQVYILTELVRFLEHRSTGVTRFDRMDGNWKDIVASVVSGANFSKKSVAVADTIANWHQECRDIALKLTELVNSHVAIKMPAAHRSDPKKRIADGAEAFAKTLSLITEFSIPDTASLMKLEASLPTKTIRVSMAINAPEDKKTPKARLNWLLRQVSGSDPRGLHVKAIWPRRRASTMIDMETARRDPDSIDDGKGGAPTAFEIHLVKESGYRFSGVKTFIDDLEESVLHFYSEVGQKLKKWQPPPPKMPKDVNETDDAEHALPIAE